MIIIEGPKEELGSFFFGGRLGDKTIRGSGTEFWNPDQGTLDAVRAKFCSRFSVPIVRNLQGGRGARLGCLKGLEGSRLCFFRTYSRIDNCCFLRYTIQLAGQSGYFE